MNESETCRQLIEPALKASGWSWDRHLRLGNGVHGGAGDRVPYTDALGDLGRKVDLFERKRDPAGQDDEVVVSKSLPALK